MINYAIKCNHFNSVIQIIGCRDENVTQSWVTFVKCSEMLRCDPTHLGICPKTNLLDWHAFSPKSDYWDWFLTKSTKREGYTTLFAQTETSRVYKSNNEVLFTSNSQYNTSLGDTKYTAPVFLILLGMYIVYVDMN